MPKILFPYIFLAFLISLPLSAQIYVDVTNGNNASAGTSAGTAVKSIQAGIIKANATANTIIYVAAGTYTTNNWGISNFAKSGVFITNTLRIYGGYTPGTFAGQVAMSELDGQGKLSHVVYVSNAANVVLDHFTLRGGFGSGAGLEIQGGGLLLYQSYGTLVTNVVASNNFSPNGGGIALNSANSNKLTLTASSNSASFGGGAYFYNAFGNTYSGLVTNNTGSSEGGGFYIDTCESNTLSGLTIANTSLYGGGGVYLWLCNSNLLSGTFQGNLAIGPGGGVYVGYGISNQMGGNFIANGASNGGGVYLGFANSNLVLGNLWSNVATNAGGGLFILSGNNNTVTAPLGFNRAQVGGGVYLSNSQNNLISGPISSNWAQNFGGGVGGDLNFSNSFTGVVSSNQSLWGGGFFLNNSYGDLIGSSVSNNLSSNGGGMYLSSSFGVQVTGFFGGNRATNGGGAYFTLVTNTTWLAQVVANNAANLGGGLFVNTSDSNNFSASIFSNVSSGNAGGMYLWGNSNRLSGTWVANQAGGVGGGLYLINGNQNSVPGTFSNNTGLHGGAVDIFSGTGNQLSGLYASNTASNGGAIFLDRFTSNNVISGNMIGNRANASGGGLYVYPGGLSNRTTGALYSNFAVGSGGGYFEKSGSGNSLGSIISNNNAMVGGAIYLEDATNFKLTNCSLGANSASGADASLVLSNGGGLTGLFISNNLFSGTNGFGSISILELGLNTTGHKIVSNGFDITTLGFLYGNISGAAITNFEIQTMNVSGSLRHDATLATNNYFYPSIATLFVDTTNGLDGAPGITPATSFKTIQYGLDSLVNFSTVTNFMVASGTYTNTAGGVALATVTNHNFRISGGWLPGNFSTKAGVTELDGLGLYKHIFFVTNVTNFVLDDVTVRGGVANGPGVQSIGGGLCATYTKDCRFTNLVVSNNWATNGGGVGFDLNYSNRFHGVVSSNFAQLYGGGLYAQNGNKFDLSGVFFSNRCLGEGGGVYLQGINNDTANVTVYGNFAASTGGGVRWGAATTTFNGFVYDNIAGYYGGGFELSSSSGSCVISGVYSNNFASNYGGGVQFSGGVNNNTFSGLSVSNYAPIGGGINVDGFLNTISGQVVGNRAQMGGGAFFKGNRGNRITGLVTGNQAILGGGLGLSNAWQSAIGGTISSNESDWGGGVHCWNGQSNYFGGVIRDNFATNGGGGIYDEKNYRDQFSGSVVNNRAGSVGSAIYLFDGTSNAVTNAILTNNNSGVVDCSLFLTNATGLSGLLISNTFFSGTNFARGFAIVEGGLNTSGHALVTNGFDILRLGFLYSNVNGTVISNYEISEMNTAGSPRHDALTANNNYFTPAFSVLFVDAVNGNDGASGISPLVPFKTIQWAVNQVAVYTNVTNILVAVGTYTNNGGGLSNQGRSGVLVTNHNLGLIGGWNPGLFTSKIGYSELDAHGQLEHVMALSNVTNNVVEGFVLRGGFCLRRSGISVFSNEGAGILLHNGMNTRVSNVIISNNASDYGAAYLNSGNKELYIIANSNYTYMGGGVFADGLSNSTLFVAASNNFSEIGGGGIHLSVCTSNRIFGTCVGNWGQGGGLNVQIGTSNYISGTYQQNHSLTKGGGITVNSGNGNNFNVSLIGNASSNHGGGFYGYQSVSNTFLGVVSNNVALGNGGGYLEDGGSAGNTLSAMIASNTANLFGGVFLDRGTNFRITGSIISNNRDMTPLADSVVVFSNMGPGLVVSNCLFAGTNASTAFAMLETGANLTGHTLFGNLFVTNYLGSLYGNYGGGIISNHEISEMNTPGSLRHDASIALSNRVNTNGVIIPSNYVIPQAVILSPPAAGTNFLVYMSSASVAGTSPITNYNWLFGDGTTSNGAGFSNVAHFYSNMLTNYVVLTVIDSQGYVATTSNAILILGYLPVNGLVSGQTTNGVSLSISSSNTNQSTSTGVGGLGLYQFWVTNDTYTVTPSKLGYRFSPPNRTFTVSGSPISNMNFTATEIFPTLGFVGITNLQQIIQVMPIQVLSDAPEMLSNGLAYFISNTPGVANFITNFTVPYGVSNAFDTAPYPDGNYTLTARVVDQPFGRVNAVSLTVTFYNQLSKMTGKGLASKQAVIYNTVVNTAKGDMVELFFYLQSSQAVRVAIYDKRGRPLMVFPDRVYPSGPNRITWETLPRSLEAGVYFAQFDCGEFSKAVPVVMVQR